MSAAVPDGSQTSSLLSQRIFNLPLPLFAIALLVMAAAIATDTLPSGMIGALLVMIFAALDPVTSRLDAQIGSFLVTPLRGLPEIRVVLLISFGSSQRLRNLPAVFAPNLGVGVAPLQARRTHLDVTTFRIGM
ncbi:hypothetical protein OEZ72_26750, partial [Leclercia adecarboxylata]|nr:hypothetical protein [Leclercia adecarboxylata]